MFSYVDIYLSTLGSNRIRVQAENRNTRIRIYVKVLTSELDLLRAIQNEWLNTTKRAENKNENIAVPYIGISF